MTSADPASRYQVSLDELRGSVEVDPADQVTEQPQPPTSETGDSWEREQRIVEQVGG